MKSDGHSITIDPVKTARLLLGISAFVMILSLLGQREYYTGNPTEKFFRELFTTEFYVNNGENIATYWNMLILIVMSVLTLFIAAFKRLEKDKYRYQWLGLGIVFFYFAIDELANVNHRFATLLKDLPNMEGGILYNWFYPVAAAIVLLIFIFFIWFYLHLDAENKYLFPISIILYIFGAYRTELLSGHYAQINGITNPTYLYLTHIEEFIGHAGIILMIYLLLTYFETHHAGINFRPHETNKA